MAKTNTLTRSATLVTHEGGTAVAIRPNEDLLRAVATCMLFEDTFYEKGSDIAARIATLVGRNTPERVAEVARLGRNELKLRHAPLWVAVQMAMQHRGALARKTVADVIQRPDELSEAIALYWKAIGDERKQPGKTKLPHSLRNGIADAFTKFDEYRLAKWNRTDRAVKLKDALFLSHPKPVNAEQDALWKRLIAGTLAIPDTWEVAYSAAQTKEAKQAIWERLISERKLGAMATLMNLRNMDEVGVPRDTVHQAIDNIGARSRLLPFRFVAAAKFAPAYAEKLSEAMLRAVSNYGKLAGLTVLVVDVSGSMTGTPISSRSKLDRLDAAGALAVLFREVCEDARIFAYATDWAEMPNTRGMSLVSAFQTAAAKLGGGTDTASALRRTQAKVPSATRVVLITDEQAHDGIAPNWGIERGYLVNVAPYAPGLDTSGKWQRINGWSDRILDWVSFDETGKLLSSEPEPDEVESSS